MPPEGKYPNREKKQMPWQYEKAQGKEKKAPVKRNAQGMQKRPNLTINVGEWTMEMFPLTSDAPINRKTPTITSDAPINIKNARWL